MAMLKSEIKIPEGVQVEVANYQIKVKGPQGEVVRNLPRMGISISKEDNNIVISIKRLQQRVLLGTWTAHVNNLIKGVQEPFVYQLKICSSHFPMSAKLQGNEIILQNFIGEKSPRRVKLPPGADVKINGEIIEVKSVDKELAGRVCTLIERLTVLTNKDRRVFMDGIYLINKAGKPVTM